MADSWAQAQQLFEAALERDPTQRADFLCKACGDDAELRTEVEALLNHDDRAGDEFLRPPDVPPGIRPDVVPAGPDPLVGTTIGNYHIKSIIASGGMGTVYLAEQDQPRRDVALKVMRAGIASRSALRRFEYESEILARLRHPNIAQVYEAGVHRSEPNRDREGASPSGAPPTEKNRDRQRAASESAIPYFAMEYIPDAKPITDFADDKKLATRDRLKLFTQVCDAVHHGHQKGIIHRDLKPANILVDSSGQTKVIDFGVARMTDSDIAVTTMQTGVGALIGTLQYMSPEQCAADPHEIDTRSDVYSLGVVLYELLCGKLPYDLARTPIPVAPRVICEKPPVHPSTIDRRLRGDLEAIVLKALEKERDERYQSAADMAQDVRRHLNREPIEARPPTPWTRALRWVARHPVAATAGTCLGIAAIVTVATFISVWLIKARPHKMELTQDGREARLLSVVGGILHTWGAGVGWEHLVEQPQQLGGRRLAIIGFGRHGADRLRRSLCAFDVDADLDRPLWETQIEASDVLPELRTTRGYVAEQFVVHDVWLFDVFPERPGDEIVAVFGHADSARVVRVYDLAGELLYQVWHDGSLPFAYWMADAGLLVFAGDCQGPFWEHGQPKAERVKAVALLAVRPELNVLNHGYLRCEPTADADDPLKPAWHLGLDQEEAAKFVARVWLEPPRPPHKPGSTVQWTMRVGRERDATVWWVVDQDGKEVPDSRDWNDTYKLNQKLPNEDPAKLPDPDSFHLDPMSEVLAATEQAEQPPNPESDTP